MSWFLPFLIKRMDMERITVFTANIGKKGSVTQRRENLNKVKAGTKDMDSVLIGFQEIDEADTGDEHGMLKTLWPHQQFGGFVTAVPALANRPLEMGKVQVTQTSPGRAKVSPTRFCTQSLIRIGDLPPFVHMNGHYPFNAEDLRRDCDRTWRLLVHEWYDQGYTIITTRDTNWHGNMPKLHPKERLLTTAGQIDRITVIENHIKVRKTKQHRINLTIDGHDAVGLSLILREK